MISTSFYIINYKLFLCVLFKALRYFLNCLCFLFIFVLYILYLTSILYKNKKISFEKSVFSNITGNLWILSLVLYIKSLFYFMYVLIDLLFQQFKCQPTLKCSNIINYQWDYYFFFLLKSARIKRSKLLITSVNPVV